jgi:putative transposase
MDGAKTPAFRQERKRFLGMTHSGTPETYSDPVRTAKVKLHYVRKRNIGRGDALDALSRESGAIYSLTVAWFWRHVRRQGLWLSEYSMKRRLQNGQPSLLHSQSAQKAIECFYQALQTWRSERKWNPRLRPPHKQKRFYKVVWKKSAIHLKDGILSLSNARGTPPLQIPWREEQPVQVEMGWAGREYEIRATYEVEVAPTDHCVVASCDLGEVHPAAIGTWDFHLLLNGGQLRAKRRCREKLRAQLNARIDRKKKKSKRQARLIESMKRKLRDLRHQIRDIEHKLTRAAIEALEERGVGTLVIGDVRDLRIGYEKGKVQNQRLHQAPMGRIREVLTQKARRRGWTVELVDEAWTSKTCPGCGVRNTPSGRCYRCASCGWGGHRDVVGQVNILEKYLGNERGCRVVGAMASPSGLRYAPHLRCRSRSPARIAAL